MLWAGLLLIEAILVARFLVVSHFYPQTYNTHPAMRSEMGGVMREHPGLQVAAIVFFGLLTFANVGVFIVIRRAFKDLRAND